MTLQLTRMLENDVMPKVLILVSSEGDLSTNLARCASDGAKAVRFTEVDVHAVAGRDPEALRDYDGIVIVGSGRDLSPALTSLLDACESGDASQFANTVFAPVGFDSIAAVEGIARLGGIIVADGRGDLAPEERATVVGKRVAKVAEWVRHALSHEHGHHHHAH